MTHPASLFGYWSRSRTGSVLVRQTRPNAHGETRDLDVGSCEDSPSCNMRYNFRSTSISMELLRHAKLLFTETIEKHFQISSKFITDTCVSLKLILLRVEKFLNHDRNETDSYCAAHICFDQLLNTPSWTECVDTTSPAK